MKTYDYINRVVLMFPLSLLCITITLRVHMKFFEITTFPNSDIRARFYAFMLYARVDHKELWAIIVILLTSMSYFDSAVLLDEAARTNLT